MLPMGIGLVHAFHNHDSTICLAVDENHIHSEKTDCDHPHYFSQTLSLKISINYEVKQLYWNNLDFTSYKPLFTHNFDITYSERGPPFFNVF